jgi:hypothetical protein
MLFEIRVRYDTMSEPSNVLRDAGTSTIVRFRPFQHRSVWARVPAVRTAITHTDSQGELSMLLAAFTFFHVVISLIGIGSGFVVAYGLLQSKRFDNWTALFLVTTIATSVTGFFFPVHHFMPSHAVGLLSLILLAFSVIARYRYKLAGAWRRTYATTAVIALYLNFFVLIAQSFQKIPALHALAPTQSEPPFAVAQLIALLLFALLGTRAAIQFRSEIPPAASSRFMSAKV